MVRWICSTAWNKLKLFGKQADYSYYSALAEQIKEAVNRKFLHRDTGIYANGSQTELSVPLQWKIVPEELVAKVAAQDTYPSWGWWIVNGATTLLENWDLKAERDISDNHMMFGEVGGWLFKGLGGIFPDPQQPGFKHILLRPNFVTGLEWCEVKHQAPCGEILSSWRWRGKLRVDYEVIVPANSTATLYLPSSVEGERVVHLEAGRHLLHLKLYRQSALADLH